MLIRKRQLNKKFYFLLSCFFLVLIYLLVITPGFKGDLEQSLRIILNEPILLKSKQIKNNKLTNYISRIYNATEHRLFNSAKFHEININVKFQELEKLKFDRKRALKYGKLFNPQKINISIDFKGKKFPATARLKGDFSEHWGNLKQWSLRIKLKNKKTILSMNEFSIQTYIERDYPYNYLISKTFRDFDILVPRYEDIKVIFNGENWGLMLLEEQFNDSFYAFNKIKEAPIFKITNENDILIETFARNKNVKNLEDIIKWQGKLETKIFNEDEILKKTNIPSTNTNENLLSIFKNLQKASILNNRNLNEKLSKHLDIKYFARVFAIIHIFGDWHSSLPFNSRYYLNPYNLKIRPILTDSVHSLLDEDFFNKLNLNLFYEISSYSKEFKKEYFNTINLINKNFKNIENYSRIICSKFGKNCLNSFNLNILKKNINFLINKNNEIFDISFLSNKVKTSKTFDTKNIYNLNDKKISFRAFNNGEVILYNLTSEIIKIHQAKYKINKSCTQNCNDELEKILIDKTLKPTSKNNLSVKKIKIKPSQSNEKYLQLDYVDESGRKFQLVEKIELNDLSFENFFKNNLFQINKNIYLDNNNYILATGNYLINEPIIIPSGFNLIIDKGVQIKMAADTYIMVENGVFKANATKDEPIIIDAQDYKKKWKGIYVNSENLKNKKSFLNNIEILNYSYFDNSKIQLTGGINFIYGDVEILNSYFKNAFSEDAINLINSKFKLKNVHIYNSSSDAIDVDFGNGQIAESSFQNIKGDALDFSGSLASLDQIYINNVSDKGISAGEETKLNVKSIKILNTRIGIASKDSSEVQVSDVEISNCGLFDFAAYRKKSYFSGASLNVSTITRCENSLAEEGNLLLINNEKIKGKKINIKKLYDGSL